MKDFLSVKYYFVTIFFFIFIQTSWGHVKVGHYKGFHKINRELSARLFIENTKFSIAVPLGSQSLNTFFGDYTLSPDGTIFTNKVPNSINYSLYFVAFNNLAQILSNICQGERTIFVDFHYNDQLIKTISTFCTKKLKDIGDSHFLQLWHIIMGFEAPQNEFLVFKTFFKETYKVKNKATTIQDLSLSIFLNPHFLMEK